MVLFICRNGGVSFVVTETQENRGKDGTVRLKKI